MIRCVQLFFFILVVFTICSPAPALERFEIVTTPELIRMLEQRKVGETDFVLVNALDELIYNNTSIPGSINVPWCRVAESVSRLGDNPDKPIIVY